MDFSFLETKHGDPFPPGDPPHPPTVRSDLVDSHAFGPAESHLLIQGLTNLVNEISSIGEHRKLFKTECANLTRRVKLLAPLFEEVKESKGTLPEQAFASFAALERALQSARELLLLCHDGSKIYLVLEREGMVSRFLSVTADLAQALDAVHYGSLEICDDVREQVELVHTQLKRAKRRLDAQDLDLHSDLAVVLSQGNDKDADNAALERLAGRLQLKTFSEIKQETCALAPIISGGCGEKNEKFEQMSLLLTGFRDLAKKDNPLIDFIDFEKNLQIEKLGSPIIPDDFRCPISSELIKDPVTVATGQTYERSCIQRWLDDGNKTCPKTDQVLPHWILTPNNVLKSLIAKWCETHGIELPKKVNPHKF